MSGFQVESACYATAELANAVVASRQLGSHLVRGGSVVAVSVESVAADSVTYRYTDVSGAVPAQSYTVQVPSIPPECALLGPVQASELSGAVIAVWIVCWAVSAATRPLRGID